jgi:peptide chain release factor subunit 3
MLIIFGILLLLYAFGLLSMYLDVQFLPISGLMGSNIKDGMDKKTCDWWNGPCLFEALDGIEVPLRDPKGPVRSML